eukprot:152862_1
MANSSISILTLLINQFEHINTHIIHCVCGEYLHKVYDASILYAGSGAACDFCGAIGAKNDVFWHCTQESRLFHANGFDICDKCAISHDHKSNELLNSPIYLSNSNLCAIQTNMIQCTEQTQCKSLQNILLLLQNYSDVEHIPGVSNQQLLQIVNDYLHVLLQHDTDQHFKWIYDKLRSCDLPTCARFKRRYRHRMSIDNQQPLGQSLYTFFIDKIHCYFQHSYDIGSRLSSVLKQKLQQIQDEMDHDMNGAFIVSSLDRRLLYLSKIMHGKRQKYNINIYAKYNQLYSENIKIKTKASNFYSFGHSFAYGYDGESVATFPTHVVHVTAKYSSLKEELLQNQIMTLTKAQFQTEYDKAMCYMQSAHVKSDHALNSYDAEYTTCRVRFIFHLEYLLSLLLYCNFTHLQQLFSKTYRENDGQDHEQFYFMGRNLKISVLKFGAKVSESRVHKFYHGVDQKLFMPHYTGYRGGIDVHGPLSTSSSFAVAMHFTDNQGLLLQFGPRLMSTSKYFATSWLSDFPHEREYLFIQNQTLVIDNIIEPSAEMEYGVLLKAVKCIGFLKNSDFNVVNYVEHTQYNVVTEIDPSMQELIRTICHHQLSKTNADFEAIESITPLATHILDTFFNTRDFTVYICYHNIRKFASFISGFFVYDDYEWIKLPILTMLFPNLVTVEVTQIKMSRYIFESILRCFDSYSGNIGKINIISPEHDSQISIKQAIHEYTTVFRKYEYFIFGYLLHPDDKLCIERSNIFEFTLKVIRMMDDLFYEDPDNEITDLMSILVKIRLNRLDIDNELQQTFNERCDLTEFHYVDWRKFSWDKNTYLFKTFSHSQIKNWINIEILDRLYPNLQDVSFNHITLNTSVMEDILQYLTSAKRSKKCLCKITIHNPMEDVLSREDVVTVFEQRLAFIGWRIGLNDRDDTCEKVLYFKKMMHPTSTVSSL